MNVIFLWLTVCTLAFSPALAAASSARSGVGAVPYADANGTGTTFRVWAPNVTSVAVAGSFNSWSATTTPLASDGNGYWSADVSGAGDGAEYKFVLNGWSDWRRDPRERKVANGNSVVVDDRLFNWEGADSFIPYHNDLVIYELHVGTFSGGWTPRTFDDCIQKIPYLKRLGISAISIMPVHEFEGVSSWGYNPASPFCIETDYGGVDGFKRLVKACHQAGIAVFVDVVHNHYSNTPFFAFDGWSANGYGGIYFYNDYRAWTPWDEKGRPDFGRPEVRDYITDNIRMFLRDYHVDGFRWDSPHNIIRCGQNYDWNADGANLLRSINNMMAAEYPSALRIAEDNAGDADMNFQAQWDHPFMRDIRALATVADDSARDMNFLAGQLLDKGAHQVVFVESHDTCDSANSHHRLPRDINPTDAAQNVYAKKRAFLANAVALTAPAMPMLFMGSEYNEDWDFASETPLRHDTLGIQNAGLVQLYGDLIALRRNFKNVSSGLKDFSQATTTVINHTGKVLGLARGQNLLVVFNWSASAYTPYNGLSFPAAGTWHCLFNSDLKSYDSLFGDVGPRVNDSITVGAAKTANVALGAYSIQIWGTQRLPLDATARFSPEEPDGCGATVDLEFIPHDGPLKNAAQVFAQVGRNQWASITNLPMTASGEAWRCSFPVPDDTLTLEVCFHDGANTWENNHGTNWTAIVHNCGNRPSLFTVEPPLPPAGGDAFLTYEVNGGPLLLSTTRQVSAHIGIDGWNQVQDLPMTNSPNTDLWHLRFPVPANATSVSVCFHDNGAESPDYLRLWDSRGGANWIFSVDTGASNAPPALSISTPAATTSTVSAATAVQILAGTAEHLPGGIGWTNAAAATGGFFSVDASWSASIPLVHGTNLILLTALNPNRDAADSDYSAFADGLNGGHHFLPWRITQQQPSSVFPSSSNTAWGAWAGSSTGTVDIIRPFLAPLQPGDTLSFVFHNRFINSGGSVGFGLLNGCNTHDLLSWSFTGGDSTYILRDASGWQPASPWTADPQTVSITLGADQTYTLSSGTFRRSGSLAPASPPEPAALHFWNHHAGNGSDHNLEFASLSLNGAPLLFPALSRSLTVIRDGSAPVTTLSLNILPDGSLSAVFNGPPDALRENLWQADTVDPATHRWNWTPLPADQYTLSNSTVRIQCPSLPHTILSIGRPSDLLP